MKLIVLVTPKKVVMKQCSYCVDKCMLKKSHAKVEVVKVQVGQWLSSL